ncbi:MAG: glycosyltransferase family 87 protein [Terracidiphilus sp.]|jgi:hypothetical protein
MNRFARPIEIKALFAFVLASLLISSLMQRYLGHVMPSPDMDFYNYYFAAQVVHDNPHANLYQGATDKNLEIHPVPPADSALSAHARAAGFEVEFYAIPPLLADLLVPLSQVPPHVAAALWRAFNLALVLASMLLLARLVRVPILSFEFVVLVLAAYSFWPIHEAVSLGQVTVVMLALCTAGVVAYRDDRVILSAAAIALATAFKVTPILLLPLFLIWKDRRWLVSYLTISLGLVSAMVAINGVQIVRVYPMVVSHMGSGFPAFMIKTLGSLAAWVYYGRIFSVGDARAFFANQPLPQGLSFVAKAISGAFYLSCLFLAWRSRRRLDRASRAATIAVFSLVAICVSPVSYRHGYTVAFVALAIFWAKALRTPPRILPAVLLTLTTFTLGSLFFDLAAQAPLPETCKILLSATWIVFSVLFCLDTLFRADAAGCADVATDRSAAAAGAP